MVRSFVLVHDVNGLNVLPANAETHIDEALTVFGVLVGLGRLESILT